MPPKKGAKGGKKGAKDDDAHWAALAAKLAPSPSATPPPAADASDDEEDTPLPAPVKSFAALGYDNIEAQEGDDDEDLMSMLAKAKGSSKKKPKKGKPVVEDDDDAEPEQDFTAPRGIVEVGADDWDEPEKVKKGKKGGKGGKKGEKKVEEEEEDAGEEVKPAAREPAVVSEAAPAKDEGDDEEEPDEPGSKVLSKKEKEKIKKEKEKAKKKAQAAAKKAQSGNAPAPTDEPTPSVPTPSVSTPAPTPAAPTSAKTPAAVEAEDADEGEGEAEGAGAKNKKKKKKKAADKKPEPAPAPKKGGGSQMAALRALVEAQRVAAEEQEKAEREYKARIEEEERRLEEEERLAAEEKARKKEKEKAKKEQLKKDGKLLTPKQKAEKAAAEIRMKALMGTAGVTIAGLQSTGSDEPRRVSYAKRERPGKKGPQAAAPEPVVEAPVVEAPPPVVEEVKEEEGGDVKDDWDASSDEEAKPAAVAEDVKDEWDASEDEEAPKPAPVKAVAPAPTKAPTPANAAPSNGKTAPSPVAAPAKGAAKPSPAAAPAKAPVAAKGPAAKAPAKGKPAAAVEESSSEEESDDDDEDDDSDDDSDDGSDDDSDDDSEDEELTATQKLAEQRKAEAKERRLAKNAEALKARSKDNMRSPICVILGHVDTGKTKLLDKIRQTNVQEGEAGGITQQIGATYFPMEAIRSKTAVLGDADLKEYKLPGLLVIDTPGHESFTNLRTRGSSLCNIAILVVDIMHGLEPQTLESLRLLREGKTPFIVALNKIDRLYGWKPIPDGGFQASLAAQHESVKREFQDRLQKTILAFAEQGLNSLPYYENKDFSKIVSLVPTSAHTGEGVPDMLMLIIKLTQERMTERLMYLSTLECTVLEVKVIEGLGTTIDVVLSNGVLREGDRIVVCGLNGPISTQVRALLTPQPMKELRIKGQYVHHKEVKASLGIKIVAPDLEKAIAGSRLLVIGEDDDEDELREEVMSDLTDLMNSVDKSGRGVCVQASTLGSLEALLEFLRTSKIPVSGINIGPVHRKDVMRAASMLEKAKELAVILCFDVPVDKEAEKVADELGIKIFKADIIYHLFDAFTAYNAAIVEAKRVDSAPRAVFPCRLKIIQCFAKRDPIIIGCDIIEGTLRVGTPLCVVRTDPETKKKDTIYLGKVTSLEINHKVKDVVRKADVGGGVAVKIEHAAYQSAKQYGRHFDDKDEVLSQISRASIDVLKEHFRNDVSKEDWVLIKQLKVKLDIP